LAALILLRSLPTSELEAILDALWADDDGGTAPDSSALTPGDGS